MSYAADSNPMPPYEVIVKSSVEKDLRSIPIVMARRILARFSDLSIDPLPRQAIKLAGAERLYRVRIGDYRIIYEFDSSSRRVIVHHVRHRSEAYRDL